MPKSWFSLIFAIHRTGTFRNLFWVMVIMGLYSAGLNWFFHEYLEKNLPKTIVLHSLLGLAISLLLVFRTNTAYERWWEGRRLWGTLLNVSRMLAVRLHSFLGNSHHNDKAYFSRMFSNFALALKEHLRDSADAAFLKYGLEEELIEWKTSSHIPNTLIKNIYERINSHYKEGVLSGEQLIILDSDLKELCNILGSCERIKSTPIPYSYSLFLKKIIFVYVMSLPFSLIGDYGYWSSLIVPFVLYVFAGLELLAEEIEDPFGLDDNDIPTDRIAERLRQNVEEILLGKSTMQDSQAGSGENFLK
ncbi:MAG TPA: bestrophin family ion channel [Leptospiraceae bacterium]|nr:bestrophin family ion channel [Leptospiraceae bacterium]HNI96672.1 bestrophin family ion channel [Leptospiraceae bacterium]